MEYYFQSKINDLKDLQHIEWVIEHIQEYEFYGNTGAIRDRLIDTMGKKNVYYSDCVDAYDDFIRHFDNNPQNYRLQLFPHDPDVIASPFPDHYFVKVFAENKEYWVPTAYAVKAERKDASIVRNVCEDGKIPCWETLNRVRDYYMDAIESGKSYIANMKVRMDETRKETSFEKVLLVIIWVLYLCLFYSNTFTTFIRNGIKLGTKWAVIMEMLKLMASAQKSFCFQFAVEIVLLFVLIGLTVKEFRKTYIGTRMKQILKHETERDTAYDQLRMAFELLLMNAEDRMMPMDFYTPAARLIHLSSLRYSFRYPLKRKPEEYSAYGMNLKKSLRNVCIIIIVLLVLRYLTINNILNLANL